MASIDGFKAGHLVAGADLRTTGIHRFGKFDSNGDIVVAGAGERGIGVICNSPNTGDPVELDRDGIQMVYAGGSGNGTVAIGPVKCGTNGSVLTATAGSVVVGQARMAGNAGDLVEVWIGGETTVPSPPSP